MLKKAWEESYIDKQKRSKGLDTRDGGVRGFNVSTRARGGRARAHPLARGTPLPDASLPVTCA